MCNFLSTFIDLILFRQRVIFMLMRGDNVPRASIFTTKK